MIDYSPYLRVTDDGCIWWLLKDAMRLGAGYRPYSDDLAVLEPELRAPNKRALANERTLIGAFSDVRLMIEQPMTFARDGIHYVEASAFLTWLSQYIAQTQAGIEFPNDLVREVRQAKAKASSSRIAAANQEFESLTLALEAWFDRPRDALPDELSYRVQKEFLVPWDALKPAQRRDVALQWDYQSDPATQEDRQFWWDFYQRMDAIEQQIAAWEVAPAPTASDLALKEARLRDLGQELARMALQDRQTGRDYYPKQIRSADADEVPATPPASPNYIAYPKAMKLLADRLEATPEELAAWVSMEGLDGGLDAFLNANEIKPPPKFSYWQCFDNDDAFDYLSPLMACWFREDDIAQFEPADRYITGKALIERWRQHPAIQPYAFICAKIRESRLVDLHPILGLSQGTNPNDSMSPPLETALFKRVDVEDIEAGDFAGPDKGNGPAVNPCHAVSAWLIRQHFSVVRGIDANDDWWKKMMREANRNGLKECRVGDGRQGPGGSSWLPHLIAAWLVDRKAKKREGLSHGAARAALKKFSGCEDVADELFPPDE